MKTLDCIKWLWKASEGSRMKILISSLIGVLHVAASMFFVFLCKNLIDLVTLDKSTDLAWPIAGIITCMLLQILLSAADSAVSGVGDIRLKNRMRFDIFSRLMTSRWDGREKHHSGDTINRMTEDVRVVSEALMKSVPSVITAGFQFVAAFGFLLFLDPYLALLIPVIMLVALFFSKRYVKKMRRMNSDIRKIESDVHSYMQESLQHRVMIHSLERSPYVSDNLAGQQQDLDEQVVGKTEYTVFTKMFIQLGFSAGYAASFLWGVLGISSGTVTFGMMTAFLQLVGQIQRPVVNMARRLPSLINSLTSAERLKEISEQPSEESGTSVYLGSSVGIKFDSVEFSYPDSTSKVFDGFSHDFLPGSSTALMGETGVGKTTMMRLMLALLSPKRGNVYLYNSESLVKASPMTRCNIVYVPQGNSLISGTIRENLLLGNPDATDEMMLKALYISSAEFVSELPDGLDSLCGERGGGLSEGQAQRIAIARGLLREGGILLLDEPTAALDLNTEELFMERLLGSSADRTIIIITHREATAAKCQNILSL